MTDEAKKSGGDGIRAAVLYLLVFALAGLAVWNAVNVKRLELRMNVAEKALEANGMLVGR